MNGHYGGSIQILWNADINILNLRRFWEIARASEDSGFSFLLQGTKDLPKNLLASIRFIFLFKIEQVPFFEGWIFILYELLGLVISTVANMAGA